LEVVGIVHAILSLVGSRQVSALPIPIRGERFNSSTDFNLNTNSSILLHCKQKLPVYIEPTLTLQAYNVQQTTLLYFYFLPNTPFPLRKAFSAIFICSVGFSRGVDLMFYTSNNRLMSLSLLPASGPAAGFQASPSRGQREKRT
jgi:hypothetical protein